MSKINKSRHIAKAITWRIIGGIATVFIAIGFGIPVEMVGVVFLADLVIKFVLYYAHERVWYKYIKFGIKK